MSQLVKTKHQANFKDFKRFGAFKGFVEQKKAYECQKKSNLHKNELNTTFFCSTTPLKAPNRLKSLKLA
jgi:hypothetical protein